MTKKSAENHESVENKRTPGRPKSENVRNTWIPVRVSREEIDLIRDSASKEGLGITEWVRKRLRLETTGYGRRSA